MKIKIKYFTEFEKKIEKIDVGDWIDLMSAEDVVLKKGEFALISLGVGMILPKGYEAHLVPRSSTFKKYHIIQTNAVGIIDNSYSGEEDIWKMPVYAMAATEIHKGDRIAQFRIVKKMPKVKIKEVKHLNGKSRGGFGSTDSTNK